LPALPGTVRRSRQAGACPLAPRAQARAVAVRPREGSSLHPEQLALPERGCDGCAVDRAECRFAAPGCDRARSALRPPFPCRVSPRIRTGRSLCATRRNSEAITAIWKPPTPPLFPRWLWFRRTTNASREERRVGGFQMAVIASELRRVAQSDLPVLILGETGTGRRSQRGPCTIAAGAKRHPRDHCAAIAPTLWESELFGVKRGAFTGRTATARACARGARGHAPCLTRFGTVPGSAGQSCSGCSRLTRVIPWAATRPSRSTFAWYVDAPGPARARAARQVRADLLARIHGFAVHLPPLRDRKEDIFSSSQHFLKKHGAGSDDRFSPFMAAPVALRLAPQRQESSSWPFDVRSPWPARTALTGTSA